MAPEQMEGHPSALPPWEVHQHAHTKCGSGQAISPEGKQISTRDPHRGGLASAMWPVIGPGGRYGGKKENWWHSKQKTGPKKSMETNWAKSWKNLGGFHHKKIGAPHHVTSEKIFSKVSKKCGKFPKMINNRRSLEGGSARVTARRTGWQPGARLGGGGQGGGLPRSSWTGRSAGGRSEGAEGRRPTSLPVCRTVDGGTRRGLTKSSGTQKDNLLSGVCMAISLQEENFEPFDPSPCH